MLLRKFLSRRFYLSLLLLSIGLLIALIAVFHDRGRVRASRRRQLKSLVFKLDPRTVEHKVVGPSSLNSTRVFIPGHETSDCEKKVPTWIWNLHQQEGCVYSQNGEDGITEALIQHIPPLQKTYVEFGTEDGSECNTRVLKEKYNWTGLLMDGGNENASIGLHQETILPDNIVSLFQKYNVSMQPDYLSEDTDYADYYIWKAILEAGYRPRILVSEINSNFLPTESATVHAPPTNGTPRFWVSASNYFGVSALALRRLWNKYGYLMVYCDEKQINCWGVRKDLIRLENRNAMEKTKLAALQDCLWEKPIAQYRNIHNMDETEETYCLVDENGDIASQDYVASFMNAEVDHWEGPA